MESQDLAAAHQLWEKITAPGGAEQSRRKLVLCTVAIEGVFVLADVVVHAVRPPELAEGEDEPHKAVLGHRAGEALLPVAAVGEEDLLLDDAEVPAFSQAPDQLYVVELKGRVKADAAAEEVSPHGDACAGSGRGEVLGGP